MKEQGKNEIKVGLTVLTGLIILFFGISSFKEWSIGGVQYRVQMQFPVSAGLQVGDEVSVNGVKSGKVESVTLRRGSVLVTGVFDRDPELSADARPVIQMLELMGGKKVDIRQGSATGLYQPSQVLDGRVDPDISGALGMLGEVQGDVRTITGEAATALHNANAVIGDREMVAALKETVANLRTMSGDMRALLAENRGNIHTIAERTARLTTRVDTLLEHLSPRVEGTVAKADGLLVDSDSLITEVRGMVRDVRESRGMLNTVLHDTTLAPRIDQLLRKLDSLSTIIIDGQMRIKIRL